MSKGRGKVSNQQAGKAAAEDKLRQKALEMHGANTVWYFRNGRGGDYHAFSNFHNLRESFFVTVHDPRTGQGDGIWYPSTEHAYQAAKTLHLATRREMSCMRSGGEVKRFANSGRLILRTDWYDISIEIMRDVVRQKFEDPQLRKILLDTGNAYLMEGNIWNDSFWGKVVQNGQLVGENNLGQILMNLRDEYRREAATQVTDRPKRHSQVHAENQQVPTNEEFPELTTSQPSKACQWSQRIVVSAPSPADQVDDRATASVSAQGETISSLSDLSGQKSIRPVLFLTDSKQAARLTPEWLVRETEAIPARGRRWNLRMRNHGETVPDDCKACAVGSLADASNACKEESVGAPINASAHNDQEVRRLQKALREIAELELQLEVLAEAGVRLRRNQMQKIAKKQEYLDKLQELGVPALFS